MTRLGEHDNRALKPDAQAFDRIEITTVPRYKMSELSGDEWRISAAVTFYRKGVEIHQEHCRNVETACRLVAWYHANATDNALGYFAGEGTLCDQEGCAKQATVRADLKMKYCNEGCSHELTLPTYRLFCDEHKKRGDCGLEDSDRNYVFSTLT